MDEFLMTKILLLTCFCTLFHSLLFSREDIIFPIFSGEFFINSFKEMQRSIYILIKKYIIKSLLKLVNPHTKMKFNIHTIPLISNNIQIFQSTMISKLCFLPNHLTNFELFIDQLFVHTWIEIMFENFHYMKLTICNVQY